MTLHLFILLLSSTFLLPAHLICRVNALANFFSFPKPIALGFHKTKDKEDYFLVRRKPLEMHVYAFYLCMRAYLYKCIKKYMHIDSQSLAY